MNNNFLDNLLDISKDMSVYKNYTPQQLLTKCIDNKLTINIIDYFKKLNDMNYYLYTYQGLHRVKDKIIFDLYTLQKLVEIKDENLKA